MATFFQVLLQYVLMALQALPALVTAGADLAAEVQGLQAQIRLFASENRDPTSSEWAAQNAALLAALAELAKARAA